MSRGRKRKSKRPPSAAPPVATDPAAAQAGSRKLVNGALLAVLALIVTTAAAFSVNPGLFSGSGSPGASHRLQPSEIEPVQLRQDEIEPGTLDELLALPADELAKVDIARMNLLAAEGLPGTENLDLDHALATLDEWAEKVAFETQRHLYRVTDPRYADHYRHSEAYFRAEMLLQVLQEDLGVRYDMTAADNFDFDDSRVAFIHGMIPAPGETTADTTGGTCASMPVMYVAIGRRLGYPLNLVPTNGHLFVRWDGENHPNPAWRERFNIEGAGEGFASFDDEYYTRWPFEVTEHEVRVNRFLVSLTPTQEFASFLAARGHCGFDNGQFAFAARAYENAYRYDTELPAHRSWFLDAVRHTSYRASTPALAQAQRRQLAWLGHDTTSLGVPRPSTMAAGRGAPARPHTARIGPWRGQNGDGERPTRQWQPPRPATPQWHQPPHPDYTNPPDHSPSQAEHLPDWGTP